MIICWGSNYGICKEAAAIMNKDKKNVGMMHFQQVWPLNQPAVRKALERAQAVAVVEGNATGQFASVLREQGLLGDCRLILKYDGMPFTGVEIARRIAE